MFEQMKIRYFVLFGFIASIATIIVSSLIYGSEFLENDTLFTNIFSYTILGVFPFIWFVLQFKKQNKSIFDVIHFKNISHMLPIVIFLTATLIVFSLGAFWLSSYILSFVFPSYVELLLQDDSLYAGTGISFVLTAIYISFLGPIVEEYIFRGLLLKRLGAKINIVASIIITNILFGILHADIIGAFMFGFILSLIYLKTNNLLLPIIFHVLNNSIVTLLVIFDPPTPDFLNYVTITQIYETAIPNLIMFVITIPILFVYIKRNLHVLS